jgi:hypothetical protein
MFYISRLAVHNSFIARLLLSEVYLFIYLFIQKHRVYKNNKCNTKMVKAVSGFKVVTEYIHYITNVTPYSSRKNTHTKR